MGIEGVRIILDDGQNTMDTTTDANGSYLFDGLCPGIYTISVDSSTVSADLIATLINAPGSTLENDSDDSTGTLITLAEAENLTIDFGYLEVIEECYECLGKVTELTLQYNGNVSSKVIVVQKDGQAVFNDNLAPGEEFTIIGMDDKGTLGTEINLYVDCTLNANIHTSCSKPIGPGLVSGDFLVTDGYSRNGGKLSPLP